MGNCEIRIYNRVLRIGSLANTQSAVWGAVYNPFGVSPTLIAGMSHGGQAIPFILIKYENLDIKKAKKRIRKDDSKGLRAQDHKGEVFRHSRLVSASS